MLTLMNSAFLISLKQDFAKFTKSKAARIDLDPLFYQIGKNNANQIKKELYMINDLSPVQDYNQCTT